MARDHFIGDAWEDTDEILEGLREAGNGDLEERYGMDATELVNYVENTLKLNDKDLARVRRQFANERCHLCEQQNTDIAMTGAVNDERVDPTLETYQWTKTEDGFRDDAGDLHRAYLAGKCGNGHDDVFILYEESWYAEDGEDL